MDIEKSFITDLKIILQSARSKAYAAVNFAMVEAYWGIGKRIVEEEQKGAERAEYGTFLIKELSKQLTQEFGKGFSQVNLRNFRKFFLTFSVNSIQQTPSAIFKSSAKSDSSIQQTVSAELQDTENQSIKKR